LHPKINLKIQPMRNPNLLSGGVCGGLSYHMIPSSP
jgi:hypothetical protein